MKTTYFASCALAAFAICSNAVATEVFVGGNVEFTMTDGEMIDDANSLATSTFQDYRFDSVADNETAFTTNADVTFKTNTKTRMIEYGAYVNLDLSPDAASGSQVDDVDAHIRVRLAHGTFKFGTDIDGLQGAEDLDWVTVGPEDFTNSITAPLAAHAFTQGVRKDTTTTLDQSSITFTSNTLNGFTVAGEATANSGNSEFDWGASLKYMGEVYPGAKLTAVVGTESSETVLANAKLSYSDITLGGMYGKDGDDDQYMGGVVAYDLGALTLTGGVMGKEAKTTVANEIAKQQDISLGMAYEVAPGLTVSAGAMQNTRYGYLSQLTAERYAGRIKLKF